MVELEYDVWCALTRSDVHFKPLSNLQDDDAFPAAFFAFLQFVYEHRPTRFSELLSPIKKK